MSQARELEQERRLAMLDRRLRLAEDRIANALQTLPRAFDMGGGGGGDSSGGRLAKALGAITPRSGATCGTGTVDRCEIDDTGAIASTGEDPLTVFNPSASTMTAGAGIDDGLYCWIQQDPDGNWIVAPLECPAS